MISLRNSVVQKVFIFICEVVVASRISLVIAQRKTLVALNLLTSEKYLHELWKQQLLHQMQIRKKQLQPRIISPAQSKQRVVMSVKKALISI